MFTDVSYEPTAFKVRLRFPQKVEKYIRIPTYQTARCHDLQDHSMNMTATETSKSEVFTQSKNMQWQRPKRRRYTSTHPQPRHWSEVLSDRCHARRAVSPWTAGRVRLELGLDAWRGRTIASMRGIERRSLHKKTQYWTLRKLAANAVGSTRKRRIYKNAHSYIHFQPLVGPTQQRTNFTK